MAMQKFKVGDIVRLKSSGPEMTVKCYEPKDGQDVTCVWFLNYEVKEASFHEEMLEKDMPPSHLGPYVL